MTAILRIALVGGLCLLGPHAAAAAEWIVDAGASRIAFSGTHTGRAFTGSFRSWRADITFDPEDLAISKAIVRIDLGSATTGDTIYDRTLPTADWLDTARSATASFETTSFRSIVAERLDFGIGKLSDAGGAWVSLDILLEITLVARRKP